MFVNTYSTNWIGQSVIKEMRLKVYGKLSRLKTSFYDQTSVGTLVTRSINDIETIADLFSLWNYYHCWGYFANSRDNHFLCLL